MLLLVLTVAEGRSVDAQDRLGLEAQQTTPARCNVTAKSENFAVVAFLPSV